MYSVPCVLCTVYPVCCIQCTCVLCTMFLCAVYCVPVCCVQYTLCVVYSVPCVLCTLCVVDSVPVCFYPFLILYTECFWIMTPTLGPKTLLMTTNLISKLSSMMNHVVPWVFVPSLNRKQKGHLSCSYFTLMYCSVLCVLCTVYLVCCVPCVLCTVYPVCCIQCICVLCTVYLCAVYCVPVC